MKWSEVDETTMGLGPTHEVSMRITTKLSQVSFNAWITMHKD